ncbi:hypothetical protein SAMN04244570_2960 [Sporosarcina newyorkensis]|uniref:Uncharacterized protein n=1 Tax=Sporosarcina newyorkensis TaxID=759851 RepID=A0A1T4YKZ1_9BACL|nr:hypothetical protein SAMN04244570_2960 [Sporosarcina newyorkensis]
MEVTFIKRLLAAIVAAIIFAVIYSSISYVPQSQREYNTYYFGFFETAFFVILYAGPVFLMVGIPCSILIDKLSELGNLHSKKNKYIKRLIFYSIAGLLVGTVFRLILMPGDNSLSILFWYSLIGFAASTIYYHVLLLITSNNLFKSK